MRSPYLNMHDVAERYRFVDKQGRPSPKQALAWIDAMGIKTKLRGRIVLAHEDDVEAALKDRETRTGVSR